MVILTGDEILNYDLVDKANISKCSWILIWGFFKSQQWSKQVHGTVKVLRKITTYSDSTNEVKMRQTHDRLIKWGSWAGSWAGLKAIHNLYSLFQSLMCLSTTVHTQELYVNYSWHSLSWTRQDTKNKFNLTRIRDKHAIIYKP